MQGAKNHTTELAEVWSAAEAEGIRGQMQVITDYLSHGLLYGLTSACDVYLSLHHGEGFGIGMAEAMLFGKPVVATGVQIRSFVRKAVLFLSPIVLFLLNRVNTLKR